MAEFHPLSWDATFSLRPNCYTHRVAGLGCGRILIALPVPDGGGVVHEVHEAVAEAGLPEGGPHLVHRPCLSGCDNAPQIIIERNTAHELGDGGVKQNGNQVAWVFAAYWQGHDMRTVPRLGSPMLAEMLHCRGRTGSVMV